jgi:hypothetical protein
VKNSSAEDSKFKKLLLDVSLAISRISQDKLNDTEKAISHLRSILEIEPDNEEA